MTIVLASANHKPEFQRIGPLPYSTDQPGNLVGTRQPSSLICPWIQAQNLNHSLQLTQTRKFQHYS